MRVKPESTSRGAPRLPDGHVACVTADLLRPRVKRRLQQDLEGELHTGPLWRGIYARDASIYEVEPLAVLIPRSLDDVRRAVEIAGDAELPLLPRGAGTSQAGQTVNRALVLDTSVHLREVVELDPAGMRVRVQPGLVLDELNRILAPHGLFYPVDVATSSRATIGGMVGNDSAGARSIKYGTTAANLLGVRVLLADGSEEWLPGRVAGDSAGKVLPPPFAGLRERMSELRGREQRELLRRVPRVPRHVAGYGLHRLSRSAEDLGQLMVGSEGTLGFFTEIELPLTPLPPHRVLGVCHFTDVRAALEAVPRLVALEPSAVELIDRVILDQAEAVPTLLPRVKRFAPGRPGALLVVEFECDTEAEAEGRLDELDQTVSGALVRAIDPSLQNDVWTVRKTGLNLSMRTGGSRKRIPFIEDCAVPVDRLVEFHKRLTRMFKRHRVSSVFYAHASVGLLHIRPGLDLADPEDRGRLRAISDETADLVVELGGSFSGEHGDGIVRADAIERTLGRRLAGAFRQVKSTFDPAGRFNPGRIVDAPAMDDPSLLHSARPVKPLPVRNSLDWGTGGVLGAAGACNQNGACRKQGPGSMCPSYRVTHDERHATRGRANALRLAMTGRLGPEGLSAPELHEALDLCVGCKACRTECPMGVDMSRLKIEALHQRRQAGRRPRFRERLFANVPRYAARVAPLASRFPAVGAHLAGIAHQRTLPRWSRDPFRDDEVPAQSDADVFLMVDTFTRWFEPENARAALRVLKAAGYTVSVLTPEDGGRPLCCGRTYLSAGWVEEARFEMKRCVAAMAPRVWAGARVVGLEPSCVLTFRDELTAVVPDAPSSMSQVAMITELLSEGDPFLEPSGQDEERQALVHGHCHEKAFGIPDLAVSLLHAVPGLSARPLVAGCCGMAGSFGYEAEHYQTSRAMAELDLVPAVERAAPETVLVANGTSCRHQIRDLTGREAVHVIRILDDALEA